MIEKFRFQVDATSRRLRLDEFLFGRIGALSKMHLRRLLSEGACALNGISASGKAGYRVQENDLVEIEADLSAATSMKPEAIPLEILLEDDEIIVVNKPAEILVHPTRGVKSGTLLNALSYHLNREGIETQRRRDTEKTQEIKFSDQSKIQNPKPKIVRPGLVHRLDKKTSGLMVIAKTPRAHHILADHFQRKLVEKKYAAVVEGTVEEDFGVINAPIGQDETLKQWRVSESGKPSETRFRVLERRADTTLLELEPVTGRTNQLRIHCEFINHPIVGDTERGGREFSRLCLHAFGLCFWHPSQAERMKFEIPLPQEFT